MSTANVQRLRDAVNDAQERVTRITDAIRAAQQDFDDVRDRHARAALLAEFDDTKKREKADLEKQVTKARTRVRELEQALPVAQDEVAKAKDALRRATAGDAMKRAEAAIREREAAMSEAARLIAKLGPQIERAEQAGLDARRAAAEFSGKERESVASSAVEPGVVHSVVEALMWRAGLRWLTDRTSLADSDDPLAMLRHGHEQKVRRWRDDVPDRESV